MSDGFVYFIKMEETGDIKIGFSEKHPEGRLKEFQTGNSNKLILLGFIEGTYQDESNLHEEFSQERIKESEWFRSSPRLKIRIKELLEESLEDKKSEIKVLNQDLYNGEYKDGLYHGQGTYTHSNGDIFEGEWKEGKRHQGTYTHSNGDIYEGDWKEGKRHGHGTYIESEGDKYVGEWKNEKRNGQGTYTYGKGKWEGDKYEGEWMNDKWHGQGTYSYPDGRKVVGEFRGGKDWNTKEYDKNGKILGKIVNGKGPSQLLYYSKGNKT